MKKSDLKSGMVVKLRDWKEKFILIGDTLCSANGKNFLILDSYDDDLKHNYNDDLDIVEVYKCEYPNLMSCFLENKLELIWEREEVDWSKVPFGTKVKVWDSGEESYEGKFLGYNEEEEVDYPFNVFVNVNYDVAWEKCELIEEPKEVNIESINEEFHDHCSKNDCTSCEYRDVKIKCSVLFMDKNYNITRK